MKGDFMNNQTPYNMPPDENYTLPPPPPVSGCSVASMILGIISILTNCCLLFVSIPCAIAGIIFAGVGMKSGKGGKGMGVAGLVLSIISIAVYLFSS